MRKRPFGIASCGLALALIAVVAAVCQAPPEKAQETIVGALVSHEYDLATEGREFLLREAGASDFFLLGELHGDDEIPLLLKQLWPDMWKHGYRHIAAEVSPWAAHQLEFVPVGEGPNIAGLWTKGEAADARRAAGANRAVLWGCDMEEMQPQLLASELARLSPADENLRHMVEITADGYDRKKAPELLRLLLKTKEEPGATVNDVSLRRNLLATLEIEANRLNPETKMVAQNERELQMKQLFLQHLRHDSAESAGAKVMLRFGRNHLHRGYDARGISTLGNFIAEFAVTLGKRAFNVGAFGAGGSASLLGETWDADETHDELAFALLATNAKYPATLFDLRPLRPLLHAIPQEKRTALETNLVYWADSYDALICYKTVTPRKTSE